MTTLNSKECGSLALTTSQWKLLIISSFDVEEGGVLASLDMMSQLPKGAKVLISVVEPNNFRRVIAVSRVRAVATLKPVDGVTSLDYRAFFWPLVAFHLPSNSPELQLYLPPISDGCSPPQYEATLPIQEEETRLFDALLRTLNPDDWERLQLRAVPFKQERFSQLAGDHAKLRVQFVNDVLPVLVPRAWRQRLWDLLVEADVPNKPWLRLANALLNHDNYLDVEAPRKRANVAEEKKQICEDEEEKKHEAKCALAPIEEKKRDEEEVMIVRPMKRVRYTRGSYKGKMRAAEPPEPAEESESDSSESGPGEEGANPAAPPVLPHDGDGPPAFIGAAQLDASNKDPKESAAVRHAEMMAALKWHHSDLAGQIRTVPAKTARRILAPILSHLPSSEIAQNRDLLAWACHACGVALVPPQKKLCGSIECAKIFQSEKNAAKYKRRRDAALSEKVSVVSPAEKSAPAEKRGAEVVSLMCDPV